jgi:hypothetical protein
MSGIEDVLDQDPRENYRWTDDRGYDAESGHYLGATCPCQPTIEYVGGGILVTHKWTHDAEAPQEETWAQRTDDLGPVR